MSIAFPYSDRLAEYSFGTGHPMRPERFSLAVELMRALDMLDEGTLGSQAAGARALMSPVTPASRDDLRLVHTARHIDAVMDASAEPGSFAPRSGIGPGDTPAFHGMHEAAALACGATVAALRAVVEGGSRRALSVAGGLHHAHPDSAAGFCVYNDPAVAIAVLRSEHPGLRVAYVDIDAHHGDGVQEVFIAEPEVLTLSVHESGRYLYPGTGRLVETGGGAGTGFALNVPLPPLADDACYRMVAREVLSPAIRAFEPDVVVAQCGADTHHADPLTHLGLTLPGYRDLVARIIETAEETCDGRICATGGGGYGWAHIVPRAWTALAMELLGRETDVVLPESWRERVSGITGEVAPATLLEDHYEPLPAVSERVRAETAALVDRVRAASPLIAGG